MKIKQERKKAYEKVKLNAGKRKWKDKKKLDKKKGEKKVKRIVLLLGILLTGVILFACAPKSIPIEKPISQEPQEQKPQITGKESWEAEWEKTLNLARKEGLVVIGSGTQTEDTRATIIRAFKDKYVIDVSWTMALGAALSQKIISERRSGIYSWDISLHGGNTSIATWKKGDILQSLRDALILPEVKDEKAWLEGKLPFLDKEGKYVFSFAAYPQSPFSINTELIANYKDELGSYYDLLKPKWKGKILARDFTITGSGLKWFGAMIEEDFGPILGMDYMRALVKQEPQIIRDSRTAAEWMLRGKFSLGLNIAIDSQLTDWKRQGIQVPIVSFTPKEGGYLTTGSQNFSFFDRAPHPNAAKIFLNWALSREGQILLTKLTIKHSTRIDIPDPGEIDPLIVARDSNVKYPMTDQEKYLEKTDEYAKLAGEIFAPLMR